MICVKGWITRDKKTSLFRLIFLILFFAIFSKFFAVHFFFTFTFITFTTISTTTTLGAKLVLAKGHITFTTFHTYN